MHAFSKYERYLSEQRYCCDVYPSWLVHEIDTYGWIFRLSREMLRHLEPEHRCVSSELLDRIDHIETLRYRKLKNISPSLKNAIEKIVMELDALGRDLQDPQMWKKQNCLSDNGLKRWKKAYDAVNECRFVAPDSEWRDAWQGRTDGHNGPAGNV